MAPLWEKECTFLFPLFGHLFIPSHFTENEIFCFDVGKSQFKSLNSLPLCHLRKPNNFDEVRNNNYFLNIRSSMKIIWLVNNFSTSDNIVKY